MKILKSAGASILALGLFLGLAFPTAAAADSAPSWAGKTPPKVLVGGVVSVDEAKASFVIQARGEEFTISVNSDTKYFKVSSPLKIINAEKNRVENGQDQTILRPMPGRAFGKSERWTELKERVQERIMRHFLPFGEEASFEDITVGGRVKVWAVPEGDSLVAKVVLIRQPLAADRVIGAITSISLSDKTITIAPSDGGEDITLTYNDKTQFILRGIPGLEAGQSVRAVYDAEMVVKVIFAPMEIQEQAD